MKLWSGIEKEMAKTDEIRTEEDIKPPTVDTDR